MSIQEETIQPASIHMSGQRNMPFQPWMNVEYEQNIRIHAKRYNLPIWVMRRLDYIFGSSPYSSMAKEDLSVEHFGTVS